MCCPENHFQIIRLANTFETSSVKWHVPLHSEQITNLSIENTGTCPSTGHGPGSFFRKSMGMKGEVESLICNFCLSVATCKIV